MRTQTAMLAMAALAVAGVVAACGGDDDNDFSDIEASATARAASQPSPSATGTEATGTAAAQSPSASSTSAGTSPASSPTAAATTPGGGSGGEDTSAYVAAARAGYEQLKSDLATLTNDMIAAQSNQADPSLPARLSADIAAVNGSAETLRGIPAPASLAAFKTDLDAALDQIQSGAASLERAIATLDQAEGATAFASLSSGQQALDAAFATLPS